MARKRFTAEQIIMKLRKVEVSLAQGRTVGQVSKQIGVTEQTCYRWRKEYRGLRMDQAKRQGSGVDRIVGAIRPGVRRGSSFS